MEQLRISNNIDEFDIPAVHRFLCHDSYWAKGIDIDTVRKAVANSLCFAGFIDEQQVAFGRAVTDLSSFAFLRDIFVLPEFRGNGYGTALVDTMITRLRSECVPSIMLGTEDAHGLYTKFGFKLIGSSPRLMAWRKE